MIKIKEFDKVCLQTGEIAYIVEILESGKAYIADVSNANGTETIYIEQKDIQKLVS